MTGGMDNPVEIAFTAEGETMFTSTFNLHKITRHQLRLCGATYASTDHDLLVSANPDFHPTDVLEDADGSLLVVATGGWYKLCCPSSQLARADVLGGVYRVRRTDAARTPDLLRGRRCFLASVRLSPA